MKNLFIAIIVIAFIFIGNQVNRGDEIGNVSVGNNTEKVKKLDTAPLFALPDYNGREVRSTDFDSKVMVVNSWAVWCPFCKDELADFAKLQEEFGDKIAVIAIDRAEPLSKVKGFTDSIDVTDRMIFLLDGTDSFYKNIGGFAMPETIFVDKEGNIALHKRGPMELDDMREHVLGIIGDIN